MPSKSHSAAVSVEGRKVGGATFNQTTLPFARADKSPAKSKHKTPENSPEDSPATVKRQRKAESSKSAFMVDVDADGNSHAHTKDQTPFNGAENEVADVASDSKEKTQKNTGGRSKRPPAEAEVVPQGKRQKAAEEARRAEGAQADDSEEADQAAAGDGNVVDAKQPGHDSKKKNSAGVGSAEAKGKAAKGAAKGSASKGKSKSKSKSKGKGKAQSDPAEESEEPPEVKEPPLSEAETVVGGRCKAWDPRDRKLYTAKMLKINGGEAFIHYLGWPSKWDHWYPISGLMSAGEGEAEIVVPTASLQVKSVSATAAVLEAVVPEGSERCPSYMVSLDGEESQLFKFPWDGEYTFTQPLPPGSTLQVRVRLKGKPKQHKSGKWGEWSEAVEVTTPEEERQEEGDGERAAKQLAIREGFCTTPSTTEFLTEEEKLTRAHKKSVQFHDSYCAVCYGWEGQLVCCDGECRKSFHPECVHLDPEDVAKEEKWLCNGCIKGVLECLLCHCPSPAEEMVVCSIYSCRKPFHARCLQRAGYAYEPSKGGSFRCPQHGCKACEKEANLKGFNAKFIKCICCPDGYHDKCLPNVGHELFPQELVPLRMICNKHEADIKKLRKLRVESSLQGSKIDTGPVVLPSHPVFKALVLKLQVEMPGRFRLPVQYAGARNYEGSKPAPFKLLQRNLYAMGRPRICKEDISICACSVDGPHRCSTLPASMAEKMPQGCGDSCENRLTCVECLPSTCPLGAQCGNQRLQKRAYARLDLFKTNGRGWGLKAREHIPAGALVQEYIGEVLAVADFQARAARYGENTPVYFFNLDNDFVIDASAMGSMARFINHSCGPNCHTEKWTIGNETRIGIFATEDIEAGAEVTYNYQFESFGGMRHKCLCGSKNCSGELGKRPRSQKELEAEQAALRKKKGKKKKGAEALPLLPALPDAPEPPGPADPAEHWQGRLVRIVPGRRRRTAEEGEGAAAGRGEGEGEGEGGGAKEGADSSQGPGAGAKAEGEGEGGAEVGVGAGEGEVLALHGEMALVRREAAEGLRSAWRVTRAVLRAREQEREERERERQEAEKGEGEVVVAARRTEKDPLARLLAMAMAVEAEWVPLANLEVEGDAEWDAEEEGEGEKEEGGGMQPKGAGGEGTVRASPSKGGGKGERKMRISKVTEERIAELAGRPVTHVKVQPQDGRLDVRDLARLGEALRAHASLSRLDLDGTLIGDEGCRVLAGVVAGSRTLQAVDLQYNGITDAGVRWLAAAVAEAEVKPALGDLHLGRNDITGASVGELERVLQRCPTLNLLLSGNKLAGEELEQVLQWHVSAGDIRGLLVECDAMRRKRREQRRAVKAEEEGEEGEQGGEEDDEQGAEVPPQEGAGSGEADVKAERETKGAEGGAPEGSSSKESEAEAEAEAGLAKGLDEKESVVESSGTDSGKASLGTDEEEDA